MSDMMEVILSPIVSIDFEIEQREIALLSQEQSREGLFLRAILQVSALEPPWRFAPPLLTEEGNSSAHFQTVVPPCKDSVLTSN